MKRTSIKLLLIFLLISLIFSFVISPISVIHRYSPQLYVIEQDIIKMTHKHDKNNKTQHRIPRIIHQTWKKFNYTRTMEFKCRKCIKI